jgi:hypothetical protein
MLQILRFHIGLRNGKLLLIELRIGNGLIFKFYTTKVTTAR